VTTVLPLSNRKACPGNVATSWFAGSNGVTLQAHAVGSLVIAATATSDSRMNQRRRVIVLRSLWRGSLRRASGRFATWEMWDQEKRSRSVRIEDRLADRLDQIVTSDFCFGRVDRSMTSRRTSEGIRQIAPQCSHLNFFVVVSHSSGFSACWRHFGHEIITHSRPSMLIEGPR